MYSGCYQLFGKSDVLTHMKGSTPFTMGTKRHNGEVSVKLFGKRNITSLEKELQDF